jgi:hypothetical protein
MSGELAGAGAGLDGEEGPYESSASLRLGEGPLVGPVLCRVVSMLLARANCPMDRMDDAMLVCDALSVHAPSHARAGHLALAVSVRGEELELRVSELPERAAVRLVQDAVLPGVGNVLERMADRMRVEPASDGAGEELVLGLAF